MGLCAADKQTANFFSYTFGDHHPKQNITDEYEEMIQDSHLGLVVSSGLGKFAEIVTGHVL